MELMSDEEIAVRVQKGDTESFGVIVNNYQAKLSRYGRKFLSDNHMIEDLVQDVFLKVYKNINSFNPKLKFSSWIYRIAHNEFVNTIRKRRILEVLSFNFDEILPTLFASETADKEVNEKELKEMLENNLSQIPAKYREILTLYYYEELSYQEISEILRIPVSTAGVRIRRGRLMLEKIFKINHPNYGK